MKIRNATINDIDEITAVEAACFPEAEAATRAEFEKRLLNYADCFWLLTDENGVIISFVDGMATDCRDLTDEMYENAALHNPNGRWQMIFGVNTLPEHRRKGYAEALLRRAVDDARSRGRVGVVLTCKDKLIHYYAKLGFVNEGVSRSAHGDAVWYQMRLIFGKQ